MIGCFLYSTSIKKLHHTAAMVVYPVNDGTDTMDPMMLEGRPWATSTTSPEAVGKQ